MKKRLTPVTWHYMIITAGFWMSFCVFTAYAAVFLQSAGYNNLELGLIMAAGNVGGALLGPFLGARIDRNRNLRHASVIYVLLFLQIAFLLSLRLSPSRGFLCTACFVLYMAVAIPVNALNLDLCVRLEHAKASLNFGLARSVGSFAFMLLSILLGILVDRISVTVLPVAGIAVSLVQLIGNRMVDRDLRNAESLLPGGAAAVQEKSASFVSFVKENKSFCLMLFGTVLIFIAHNMDGNFLINLVTNVGGSTEILGYLAAFTALVEIPVMIFASRLPRRWTRADYIRASFVFFALKIFAYALAPNIPLLFAARILQAPSYALYTVLIVGYADETVSVKDSAKAQSLAFSMTTIGSVLASLIGGRMFDAVGVRPTMLVASGIAAAGAVIAILGTFGARRPLRSRLQRRG